MSPIAFSRRNVSSPSTNAWDRTAMMRTMRAIATRSSTIVNARRFMAVTSGRVPRDSCGERTPRRSAASTCGVAGTPRRAFPTESRNAAEGVPYRRTGAHVASIRPLLEPLGDVVDDDHGAVALRHGAGDLDG